MLDSTLVREQEETLAEPGQVDVIQSHRAQRRALPSVLRYFFIASGGMALAAAVFYVLIQVGV